MSLIRTPLVSAVAGCLVGRVSSLGRASPSTVRQISVGGSLLTESSRGVGAAAGAAAGAGERTRSLFGTGGAAGRRDFGVAAGSATMGHEEVEQMDPVQQRLMFDDE
jgi:hypothetical protein